MKRTSLVALLTMLVGSLALAATAQARFEIVEFDGQLRNIDGSPATQAASHADLTTTFVFPTKEGLLGPTPDGNFKDAIVTLPPGMIGDPTAAPRCTQAQLAQGYFGSCPDSTQIGTVVIGQAHTVMPPIPVYNLVPPPGVAAQFGFSFLETIVRFDATVVRRDGAYVIEVGSRNTSVTLPIVSAETTFWGVPADPRHDPSRGSLLGCNDAPAPGTVFPPCPPHTAKAPFMTMPSDCQAGPSVTKLRATSWQEPQTHEATYTSHLPGGEPVGVAGCENLSFKGALDLQPDSRTADSPAGLTVELSLANEENPDGLGSPPLKDAVVQLPEGMRISAAGANGAAGCSPAQIRLESTADASCPDASKLGSLQIKTPVLDEPLGGSVYLATQGTNPFNSLLAIYLVAEGPGFTIKLPGKVEADPVTGRLTTSFSGNPQMPFTELSMRLDGGPSAAIVTPSTCGTYTTEYRLSSWAGHTVQGRSSFKVDQGCERSASFAPGFQAGSANPLAGAHSPFSLRVTRPDGQPNVGSIEATLPEGLLAKLAGVALCGEAEAATGNCPAASQVGSATVGVGAGIAPLYVPQPGKAPTAVYLAGPYKGAPYSLVAKVPAQAGPFDLGTVAVRNALRVDPTTAQVTASSDPLPQILQGIPIAYRDIRVDVDRPQFTINPTSCDPMRIDGTIGSSAGQSAKVSDRFQVGSCERLGFKPALKLKVSGGTKRGSYTKLRAELNAPKGQANIGKASVALPHSIFLAQEHIRTICTRVQYAARQCPAASVYGWARAFTPLLDKPLEGPVYLRSSSNELPDLLASLDGQIHIDLAGRIDSVNGGIRTTFEAVPDAPVSKFVISMKGGKKSLLVNSTNLCRGVNHAVVKMDGHNGKAHDFQPVVGNSCGKKGKKQQRGGKRK
jgi:hypothetical protein